MASMVLLFFVQLLLVGKLAASQGLPEVEKYAEQLAQQRLFAGMLHVEQGGSHLACADVTCTRVASRTAQVIASSMCACRTCLALNLFTYGSLLAGSESNVRPLLHGFVAMYVRQCPWAGQRCACSNLLNNAAALLNGVAANLSALA
jgi:hypothetical protein